MGINSKDRPRAEDALQDPWMQSLEKQSKKKKQIIEDNKDQISNMLKNITNFKVSYL